MAIAHQCDACGVLYTNKEILRSKRGIKYGGIKICLGDDSEPIGYTYELCPVCMQKIFGVLKLSEELQKEVKENDNHEA